MHEDIEFYSEGTAIRGRLYMPEKPEGPVPAILMAPGFGGLIQHSPAKYAEFYAKGGFASIAFDNPRFGVSDGTPRHDVDPHLQRKAYRDAISFAQGLDAVDPERIGLWGSSFSGGHVIEVAAQDQRVTCVVAQVPSISGSAQAVRRYTTDTLKEMRARFDADRAERVKGAAPATMPLVSVDPDKPGYFNTQAAYDNYMVDGFINEITLRSMEATIENEPGANIERISPRPLMMIVADNDEATPTDLALAAFNRALEPKRLLIVKGGHFSPYEEHFELTSTSALDWFVTHLKP